MKDVSCHVCGVIFNIGPSREKNKTHHCSVKCLSKTNSKKYSKKIIKNCPICEKEISLKPHRFKRAKDVCCSKKCSNILKETTVMGRSNPNCSYNIDDNFFSTIDTELKAYLLGWIASDGHIARTHVSISIRDYDKQILEKIVTELNWNIPIKDYKKLEMVNITLSSKQICIDLCKLFQIPPGKKSETVNFPNIDQQWHKAFIRGVFDGDGTVGILTFLKRTPRCSISMNSRAMISSIQKYSKITPHFTIGKAGDKDHFKIEWNGVNCVDFLGWLYDGTNLRLRRKYERYLDICTYVPGLLGHYGKFDKFRYVKTDVRGVAPFKERASDSGYDITLIDILEVVGDVTYYRTGIKIQPVFGWYFDLTARSSLGKLGYSLVDIGVIDRGYAGEIIVPLYKFDKSKPDIELPKRCVQIIPRPIIHTEFQVVESFEETARDNKGFGSSGG